MSETPKDQKAKKPKLETEPGSWGRFENAVDAAVKSGPKHRVPSSKPASPKPHKSKQTEKPDD